MGGSANHKNAEVRSKIMAHIQSQERDGEGGERDDFGAASSSLNSDETTLVDVVRYLVFNEQ